MRDDITDVHVDNACKLSFEYNTYYDHSDTPDPGSSARITIPLGAVTDIANEVNPTKPPYLGFSTGNINAISTSFFDGSSRADSNYGMALELTPPDKAGEEVPDSAQHMQIRLKDALMHLVGMCKGRYVAKPKKPEPF